MHTEVETAQAFFPHENPALFRVLFTKAKKNLRNKFSQDSVEHSIIHSTTSDIRYGSFKK